MTRHISFFSLRHTLVVLLVALLAASSAAEESQWGELIFEDDFQRTESQEEKDEPGNHWTTSSDKTAYGEKQVDLRDGYLHVYTHEKAWHATSVRQTFEFADGTIGLKIRFENPDDSIKLNFTDLKEKSVHAGHLFNVEISPGKVTLTDLKTGVMNLDIRKLRKAGTLSDEQKKALSGKSCSFKTDLAVGEWHQVHALVRGDSLRCFINGELVGEHRSLGFRHPSKTMIRLLVPKKISVDDVRIWKLEPDLVTPEMTDGSPAPGKRVRQVAPEYEGTEVHHALYLPTDWRPGRKYPVIVEYTGNDFPPCGSTGEVKDANLGYGISGGKGFIWVSMPCIEVGRKKNAVKWWGDREATVDYCKVNLPRICEQFGGDPENCFVCGFSRGAIGSSYIGLADDEIASLWKGMFTHDHFDGQKKWGYPDSDRESALKRLARLKGRPVLVGGQQADKVRDEYLKDHLNLADFTFLKVRVKEIFDIPDGPVVHAHTDCWMHRASDQRKVARKWIADAVGENE